MLILLVDLLRIYNWREVFCSKIKSTFGQIRRDKNSWTYRVCVLYHIDCSKWIQIKIRDTQTDAFLRAVEYISPYGE